MMTTADIGTFYRITTTELIIYSVITTNDESSFEKGFFTLRFCYVFSALQNVQLFSF